MDEKVHEKLDAILKERIFDFVGMIEQRRLFEARVFITNIFYAGCKAQSEATIADLLASDNFLTDRPGGVIDTVRKSALAAAEIKEAK